VLSTSKLAHLADRFLTRWMTDVGGAAHDQGANEDGAAGLQPAMRLRSWGSPSICLRASRW